MRYFFANIDKEGTGVYLLALAYLLVISDGMRDGTITNHMAIQAVAVIVAVTGIAAFIFLSIILLSTLKIPEAD